MLSGYNVIHVNIAQQILYLKNATGEVIVQYPISSAKNGLGEKNGSGKTPRGKHIICEKIGEDMPIFTVFRARKPTGEIFSTALARQFPDRDWILSRILWLSGMEMGFNCGAEVDTRSRYIYIHGTSDEKNIGKPVSHGCIRMRSCDVMDLFDRVTVNERVVISNHTGKDTE